MPHVSRSFSGAPTYGTRIGHVEILWRKFEVFSTLYISSSSEHFEIVRREKFDNLIYTKLKVQMEFLSNGTLLLVAKTFLIAKNFVLFITEVKWLYCIEGVNYF